MTDLTLLLDIILQVLLSILAGALASCAHVQFRSGHYFMAYSFAALSLLNMARAIQLVIL